MALSDDDGGDLVTVEISARALACAREIAIMAGADDGDLSDRHAVEGVIFAKVQELTARAARVLSGTDGEVH